MKLIKLEKSSGCNSCKLLDFVLDDFGVKPHQKIDLMSNPDIAVKFNIMKVPALILVDDNGLEIDRMFGTNEGEVKAFLENADLI
jgi:thiol-disulfide isomerase/thioredoxin